jgi:propionyl-CoA synthetase
MRKIADNRKYTTPATIEDPASLDVIKEAARKIGYA